VQDNSNRVACFVHQTQQVHLGFIEQGKIATSHRCHTEPIEHLQTRQAACGVGEVECQDLNDTEVSLRRPVASTGTVSKQAGSLPPPGCGGARLTGLQQYVP
jgi:hypothetical protein